MVWEQQCKVIIMATDLSENGVEKCAQYLPSSVVLDNVQNYGNFQVKYLIKFESDLLILMFH